MSSKYPTTSKEYHKEYYKKYKDMLKYKRDCAKNCKVSEDVVSWKAMMEANPNCFYPFANPLDISTNSPSSSPLSSSLEAIKYS
jgi:hypothetical protein